MDASTSNYPSKAKPTPIQNDDDLIQNDSSIGAGQSSAVTTGSTHKPKKDTKNEQGNDQTSGKNMNNTQPKQQLTPQAHRHQQQITVNLSSCRYEIIREIATEQFNWRCITNNNSNNANTNSLQEQAQANSNNQNPIQRQGSNNIFIQQTTIQANKSSKQNGNKEEQQANKQNNNADEANNSNQQVPQQSQPVVWDIMWQDHGINPDLLSSLLPFQRVNHFLGMYNIARKNTLSIHLKRFKKEFPEYYNFFPNTWLYPSDFYEINEYVQKKQNMRKELVSCGVMTQEQSNADPVVMLICKPEAGCQGKGIFIARRVEDMQKQIDQTFKKQHKEFEEHLKQEEYLDTAQMYSTQTKIMENTGNKEDGRDAPTFTAPQSVDKVTNYVVQKYLKNPALWKEHKYDFRIYVLVTSVIDPMTIFLFKDGLVRLASEKYSGAKNINDPYIHLTNYSLNKKNANFDGSLHKLKLSDCLKGQMTQPGRNRKPGVSRSSDSIWQEIEEIVIKTIITVQPQLQHIYRSCQTKEPDNCFELLGFDIMLDHKLRPWMLEVNHTPSFGSDTTVDAEIKQQLISNTLAIIQQSVIHRKKVGFEMRQEQKLAMQSGQYRRLTAKEHSERVRFDPIEALKKIPNNKYKLIYPKEAPGGDPDLYLKFQKKAEDIWKATTGTNVQKIITQPTQPKKTKKKRKKVSLPVSSQPAPPEEVQKNNSESNRQSFDGEGTQQTDVEGKEPAVQNNQSKTHSAGVHQRLSNISNLTNNNRPPRQLSAANNMQQNGQNFSNQQQINSNVGRQSSQSHQNNMHAPSTAHSAQNPQTVQQPVNNQQLQQPRTVSSNPRQPTKSSQAKQVQFKHRRGLLQQQQDLQNTNTQSITNILNLNPNQPHFGQNVSSAAAQVLLDQNLARLQQHYTSNRPAHHNQQQQLFAQVDNNKLLRFSEGFQDILKQITEESGLIEYCRVLMEKGGSGYQTHLEYMQRQNNHNHDLMANNPNYNFKLPAKQGNVQSTGAGAALSASSKDSNLNNSSLQSSQQNSRTQYNSMNQNTTTGATAKTHSQNYQQHYSTQQGPFTNHQTAQTHNQLLQQQQLNAWFVQRVKSILAGQVNLNQQTVQNFTQEMHNAQIKQKQIQKGPSMGRPNGGSGISQQNYNLMNSPSGSATRQLVNNTPTGQNGSVSTMFPSGSSNPMMNQTNWARVEGSTIGSKLDVYNNQGGPVGNKARVEIAQVNMSAGLKEAKQFNGKNQKIALYSQAGASQAQPTASYYKYPQQDQNKNKGAQMAPSQNLNLITNDQLDYKQVHHEQQHAPDSTPPIVPSKANQSQWSKFGMENNSQSKDNHTQQAQIQMKSYQQYLVKKPGCYANNDSQPTNESIARSSMIKPSLTAQNSASERQGSKNLESTTGSTDNNNQMTQQNNSTQQQRNYLQNQNQFKDSSAASLKLRNQSLIGNKFKQHQIYQTTASGGADHTNSDMTQKQNSSTNANSNYNGTSNYLSAHSKSTYSPKAKSSTNQTSFHHQQAKSHVAQGQALLMSNNQKKQAALDDNISSVASGQPAKMLLSHQKSSNLNAQQQQHQQSEYQSTTNNQNLANLMNVHHKHLNAGIQNQNHAQNLNAKKKFNQGDGCIQQQNQAQATQPLLKKATLIKSQGSQNVYSLEKLKEYETRLLQNSTTQSNLATTGPVKGMSQSLAMTNGNNQASQRQNNSGFSSLQANND